MSEVKSRGRDAESLFLWDFDSRPKIRLRLYDLLCDILIVYGT